MARGPQVTSPQALPTGCVQGQPALTAPALMAQNAPGLGATVSMLEINRCGSSCLTGTDVALLSRFLAWCSFP